MIFKSDILDAINELNHDLLLLSERVHDLEVDVKKLKKISKTTSEPKRRGRPVGSKNKRQ